MSSNPHQDLNLEKEYREIDEAIKKSKYRDQITLISKLSAHASDLIDTLNNDQPDIFHFSGHGTKDNGALCFTGEEFVVVETNEEGEQVVTPHTDVVPASGDALDAIFELAEPNLKLVILDSCYSKTQADIIVEHIDYVIGMNHSIGERTATTLVKQFYRSLIDGKGIEKSFKQAKALIGIEHIKDKDVPELLKKSEDVKDIDFAKIEQEQKKSNNGGTTINIDGDITGVGVMLGGTLNQK